MQLRYVNSNRLILLFLAQYITNYKREEERFYTRGTLTSIRIPRFANPKS